MTIAFPVAVPDWASNANYSTGPDVGTPTKVDPGSAANGYIKGVVAAPQHVNYALNLLTAGYNQHVQALNRALTIATLHLHALSYTSSDTGAAMGATMVDGIAAPAAPVIAIKVDSTGVAQAYDSADTDTGGTVASVSSLVKAAATNGSRIVAIGVGGNLNTYSDNGGGSWSAGAAGVGGAVEHLAYAPVNALTNLGNTFLSGGSGTGSVYRSINASTIWSSAASGFAAVLGLAVLGGATANKGYIVALGNSGFEPRFSLATDGDGTSFTGTQQPPNANTAEEPGSIAGAPAVNGVGDAVYHVMRCNAGARLRTARSINGFTWSAATTLQAPTGGTFSGAPRLMICQSTGLQVIAAPMSSGVTALYASVDFTTWLGPTFIQQVSNAALAVAGGKLFMTRGATIYASAGIGSV